MSPWALLRMTRRRNDVSSDVFSILLVVASMRENTFASAA